MKQTPTHPAVKPEQTDRRVANVCLTAVTIAALWMVGQIAGLDRIPTSSATESPASNTSESFVNPIASPISVVFPDTLIIVTQTAIPQTPTPVSTYQAPTMVPPLICGPWVKTGQQCTMPPEPTLTPTPIAPCPVAENEDCIWTGRAEDASPVVQAPTPIGPMQ